MPIEIRARDIEIMKFVYKYRVATYPQIRQRIFMGSNGSAPRDRIRKLCNHGFLKSLSLNLDKDFLRGVRTTEKSWPYIKHTFGFEIERPHFKSESIHHDVRLVEIGQRFEKLKLYDEFLTENLLQSSDYLTTHLLFKEAVGIRSDGVLSLKGHEGSQFVYAIELEVSKKSPERYRSKLNSYYQTLGLDGVIYICGDTQIKQAIERADREVSTNRKSIVYLGLEEDVMGHTKKLIFYNKDGDGIGLY